jgi:cell division protein ZapA
MTDATTLTLTLLGKNYQVKCQAEEKATLEQAARYLEEKLQQTQAKSRAQVPEQLFMLTALALSHELQSTEKGENHQIKLMGERIAQLKDRIDSAMADL